MTDHEEHPAALADADHRYRPYLEQFRVDLPDRTWPTKRITQAPRWCAVDLRDGNQALIDPMSPERKRIMFDLLVRMGYKEIEVGFPSASQTDFDFVRSLIEEDAIPDDVTIQVLTQAREHLIARTYESIKGAKQAIVHLYNSTSILQRDVVFRTDKQGIIDIALEGARLCRQYEDAGARHDHLLRVLARELHGHRARVRGRHLQPGARGLRADRRAQGHHQPAGHRRDGDAERLRRLDRVDVPPPEPPRERDPARCTRTTTAAPRSPPPSSATMAGADRIEGCLFGNGERTGNVDLVALGINLFTQGIDPQIDFSDLDRIRAHRRALQPAAGARAQPVGAATSSTPRSAASHQDAIKKGFEAMAADAPSAQGVTVDAARVGRALPAGRPEGPGPQLRGGHPGQLAVRQGRRRLPAEDGPRPRPAAQAADRVLRRRAGEDGRRGRRGHERRDLGRSSRTSTCPPRPTPDAKWGRFELLGTRTASDMSGDGRARRAAARRRRGRGGDAARATARSTAFLDDHGRARATGSRSTTTSSTRCRAGGDARAAAYVELRGERQAALGRRHRRGHLDGVVARRSSPAVNRAVRAEVPALLPA